MATTLLMASPGASLHAPGPRRGTPQALPPPFPTPRLSPSSREPLSLPGSWHPTPSPWSHVSQPRLLQAPPFASSHAPVASPHPHPCTLSPPSVLRTQVHTLARPLSGGVPPKEAPFPPRTAQDSPSRAPPRRPCPARALSPPSRPGSPRLPPRFPPPPLGPALPLLPAPVLLGILKHSLRRFTRDLFRPLQRQIEGIEAGVPGLLERVAARSGPLRAPRPLCEPPTPGLLPSSRPLPQWRAFWRTSKLALVLLRPAPPPSRAPSPLVGPSDALEARVTALEARPPPRPAPSPMEGPAEALIARLAALEARHPPSRSRHSSHALMPIGIPPPRPRGSPHPPAPPSTSPTRPTTFSSSPSARCLLPRSCALPVPSAPPSRSTPPPPQPSWVPPLQHHPLLAQSLRTILPS